MMTDKQKKSFESANRMCWDAIRKIQKEKEAKRKAERRERNKYWMEVITFIIIVLSVLYSCLAPNLKRIWQWLLSLWSE